MSIVNLFKALRDELQVSIVYITHDLATAYYISDRVLIMQRGKAVESGDARVVLDHPQHPYSILLKNAVLSPEDVDTPPPPAPRREFHCNRHLEGSECQRKVEVGLDRESVIAVTDPRLFGAFINISAAASTAASTSQAIRSRTRKDSARTCSRSCASSGRRSCAIRRQLRFGLQLGGRRRSGEGPPRALDLAWMSTEPNTFGTK